MSVLPIRYNINLSVCFSCEKIHSPTSRCDCGFNVDTVCLKIMGLCQRKEIYTISYLTYIIESFTLKHVKKISSKFGYVSSISLGVAAKVCAIEFAMRSDWFKFGNYRDMLANATSEVERFADYTREDIHEARMCVWNAVISDRRILTPPLIGTLRQDIYRSKLTFAQHIQTDLANNRAGSHAQIILLPDNVTYTLRIHPMRPNGSTSIISVIQPANLDFQAAREAADRNEAISASLETQRIERDKKIADNKVKTWKSISIITNVLEKPEDQYIEDSVDEVTCPICCDYIIHSTKAMTNCGHTVCSNCVSDMITKCGAKCIMCRAVITSVEFGSIAEIVKCQNIKIKIISE